MQASSRSRILTVLLESLLTTLLPGECQICHQGLTNVSRLPVCTPCLASIQPERSSTCRLCGERLEETSPLETCGFCARAKYPFARAVAYTGFSGEARELLHLLKYRGVRTAAAPLGRLLAESIRKLSAEFPDDSRILAVPVPLHARKHRARGFNQSEAIARAALPHLKDLRLQFAPGVLRRARHTESQAGLSHHQRRANVRGSFEVRRPERVKNRIVLLLDDVYTTGTTAAECARTLKRAGASQVYVATVARSFKFSAVELDRWHFQGTALSAEPKASAAAAAHRT